MILVCLNKLFSSFLFVGYIKKGGGSVAAIITMFLMLFVHSYILQIFLISIIVLLGTITSEYMETIWGHDSYKIVIDEVAGMLLAIFLLPQSIYLYFIAFLLFRFFDIYKIYPIDALQNINGGAGVMLDDIVSGIFSNIIIWTFLWIKMQF